MVMVTNCEKRGGRSGWSVWDSKKEASTSARRQKSSESSGITKTSGGSQGDLHGQLMQQPLGTCGHEGHIGHVGRMLFLGVWSLAMVCAGLLLTQQAPQF